VWERLRERLKLLSPTRDEAEKKMADQTTPCQKMSELQKTVLKGTIHSQLAVQ
jgi:hypothetical protein